MTQSDSVERLEPGSSVKSPRFGLGIVIVDSGATIVARFAHGIEECSRDSLSSLGSFDSRIRRERWDVPIHVINRLQAEAITSVNATWGIFSRARMELLPHQLWVCRKVNAEWPARWLVADDVGLGKTVEAGMILWPLIARGIVRRLLVLCPASLVDQWQYRMLSMFDIRLLKYSAEADSGKSSFWDLHNSVVASLHTLRLENKSRHERFFNAEPWDLVIVDEAHHLNSDEQQGHTLGYRLIKRLVDEQRATSMVFFTGTPHRGKEFNFISLLELLRPDLFDHERSLAEQFANLPDVMIRNNKSAVTDLAGRPLFKTPTVSSLTYAYSDAEQSFYDLLTQFIASGRAYASRLNESEGRAVVLVLVAMQKLASSSVAAIRSAVRGRLTRIRAGYEKVEALRARVSEYSSLETDASGDELARLEEELVRASAALRLVENEREALEELLAAADAVDEETKIARILEMLDESFTDRSVLFFTEYKATQALLMGALLARYGVDSATFINGDDRLEGVTMPDGSTRPLSEKRESAADKFNAGDVRFLISTEAGGEGIDLQEACHTLVHVDLPWNPMRLHQRVGRLNRYGQKERVDVVTLRNPDTVESLIWDHLNTKLERISRALGAVMEEPEDLLQLVLGMASPTMWRELFSEATGVSPATLGRWFDSKTASFGGEDAVRTVRDLIGNVAKFDFKAVSADLPHVDLSDLKPFLEVGLARNGRKLREETDGIAFITPDAWRTDPLIATEYKGVHFDRTAPSAANWKGLLGVGHKLVNAALGESAGLEATAAVVPADTIRFPLVVFKVRDRVTGEASSTRAIVVGLAMVGETEGYELLRDWELLLQLNGLPYRKNAFNSDSARSADPELVARTVQSAMVALEQRLDALDHGFRYPSIEPMALLWPETR